MPLDFHTAAQLRQADADRFLTLSAQLLDAFPELHDWIDRYPMTVLELAGDWLAGKTLFYWGDIDTHGFRILNRVRAAWPHTRSLLMDRATLMAHQPLWGREPKPIHHDLPHLDPHERVLYRDLADNRLGDQVRLEQERIGFDRLRRVLGERSATCKLLK